MWSSPVQLSLSGERSRTSLASFTNTRNFSIGLQKIAAILSNNDTPARGKEHDNKYARRTNKLPKHKCHRGIHLTIGIETRLNKNSLRPSFSNRGGLLDDPNLSIFTWFRDQVPEQMLQIGQLSWWIFNGPGDLGWIGITSWSQEVRWRLFQGWNSDCRKSLNFKANKFELTFPTDLQGSRQSWFLWKNPYSMQST